MVDASIVDRTGPNLPLSIRVIYCLPAADDVELYDAIRRSGVPERIIGIPRLHPVRRQSRSLRAGFLLDPDDT
ncbi:MAG: hypothetical protein LH471_00490 [Salinibacterium sp.]|nr:hypothetical protein [Salinibacterium sp.]